MTQPGDNDILPLKINKFIPFAVNRSITASMQAAFQARSYNIENYHQTYKTSREAFLAIILTLQTTINPNSRIVFITGIFIYLFFFLVDCFISLLCCY